MSLREKLIEFKGIWNELYRRTKDEYISYVCLTGYHSAKSLSEVVKASSSASRESYRVDQTEARLSKVLEEALGSGVDNPAALADRIAQTYKEAYKEKLGDDFYHAMASLELISYLAKTGGEAKLRNINKNFLSILNYSVYELEKNPKRRRILRGQLGKQIREEEMKLDKETIEELKKLIAETW